MSEIIIFSDASEVDERLLSLGLEKAPIIDVVRQGYFAFISSTANHPPLYPGFVAWGEMVRGLREYLLPQGWTRCDENNYSRVINPSRDMAIVVATGDPGTGQENRNPTTNAPKGPSTVEAVSMNFDLFQPLAPLPERNDELLTWILLVHRTHSEVFCELSLPSAMGNDGRVDFWQERVIIGAIPMEYDPVEIAPPSMPDIDVDVKRKA